MSMALLLSSCTPRVAPTPGPAPLLTEQTPFGPGLTLSEMLEQTLRAQYPLPRIDFPVPEQLSKATPSSRTHVDASSGDPSPEHPWDYFMELSREPVTLSLVSDATAFLLAPSASSSHYIQALDQATGVPNAGIDAGLAVGQANGDIRIWSGWPCTLLTLPTQTPVTLLTWDGIGPFLGAGNAQSGELHVFDLRHCARVATVPKERPLRQAALSSALTWVAVTDTGQRLFVGPTSDPLFDSVPTSPALENSSMRHVGTLRFPPLALAFSPREGLLQSVDQAGWLLIWTLPDLSLLEQVRIPGGPFADGLFYGGHLLLRPVDDTLETQIPTEESPSSEVVAWDIPNSRAVDAKVALSFQNASLDQAPPWHLLQFFAQFRLDAGLLTFRTDQEHWLRKLHFGAPRLSVHAAEDIGLLRVTEPDQTQRWYHATSGMPAKTPNPEPAHLRPLAVAPDGTVDWDERTFVLADPIFHRDGFVLLARHVPEYRFFLWWTPDQEVSQDLENFSAHGEAGAADRLPLRISLLQETPPSWISISDQLEYIGDTK
ncbi:hypothetical protein [Desulfonatronum thioautotrophicum]|uniref:hypothetical protein n=1 Tax=Desulfonatronum thioautotrophicum TaxID=617001 RepID=UPI0012947D3E|nr:hypothetical protein [Desulfonatronum thioautotrophicum]